jgi:hypothetical protein
MLSPPQVRFFTVVPEAPPSFAAPQRPPAAAVVKVYVKTCGMEVLVDVDVDDDVDVLDDELLVLDDVDVLGAVELVLLELDVVLLVDVVDPCTEVLVLEEVLVVLLVDELEVVLARVEVVESMVELELLELELLVVVTVGTVEVLLLDDVDVLELVVVVPPSQGEKSSSHSGVQVGSGSSTRAPPGDPFGHMAPPRSSPSHASPPSRMPLPHTACGMVVVELLVVELLDVLGALLLVDVLDEEVVVVPAAGMPATVPMARMRSATKRPRSSAPFAMLSREKGAQACSMPLAPWPKWTEPETQNAMSCALRPELAAGPV